MDGYKFLLSAADVGVIALFVAMTYLVINVFLAKKHASLVFTLWLGFSFATLFLFSVLLGAKFTGVIDAAGNMEGFAGHALEFVADFFVGVAKEAGYLGFVIFLVFSVPALAFILAAPSQCAQRNSVLAPTIRAGSVLLIKGLIGAAGAFTAILLADPFLGMGLVEEGKDFSQMARVSAATVFFTFVCTYIYLEIPEVISHAIRYIRQRRPEVFAKLDRAVGWATENNKEKVDGSYAHDAAQVSRILYEMQNRHALEKQAAHQGLMRLLAIMHAAGRYDGRMQAFGPPKPPSSRTAKEQVEYNEQVERRIEINELRNQHNL